METLRYLRWICSKCKFLLIALFFYMLLLALQYVHVFQTSSFWTYVEDEISKRDVQNVVYKTTSASNPVHTGKNKTYMTKTVFRTSTHRPGLSTKVKAEKKILDYNKDFHMYPLDIDLPKLIKAKKIKGKEIEVTPINPHDYTYIHRPNNCMFTKRRRGFRLAILVKSSADNFNLRKVIRKTWGNTTDIPVIFFLGATSSKNQSRIDKEFKVYSDLVQENFIDAYMNNTLKTIMTFNWASKHCSEADFLFFVDDDHFVLVNNILSYIKNIQPMERETVYEGFLLTHSAPYRSKKSKWNLSPELYPFKKYPPYLAGGAFLASISIVQQLSLAFPYVQYIGIDDCYMGIVAKKLNIIPKHNQNFYHRIQVNILRQRSKVFASHGYGDPALVRKVYKELNKT